MIDINNKSSKKETIFQAVMLAIAIILFVVFATITFIYPTQVSAMSQKQIVEQQYKQALVEVINLLMKQVEELVKQLNELQTQTVIVESVVVEQETKEEYIKPFIRPDYNLPIPINNRCNNGSIDIKIGDKNCK